MTMGRLKGSHSFLVLLLLVTLAVDTIHGFSVSKSIFSRKGSPKVLHIPISPSCSSSTSCSLQIARTTPTPIPSKKSYNPIRRWWSLGSNRLSKLQDIVSSRSSARKNNRAFLFLSAASALAAMVVRPSLAFAMGGGMGGLKGPIAPMQRLVPKSSVLQGLCFLCLYILYIQKILRASFVSFSLSPRPNT